MGKTRIAAELAGRVLTEYPDGVWLMRMAALSDPADVPREVAATLAEREPFGQSQMPALAAHVASRGCC